MRRRQRAREVDGQARRHRCRIAVAKQIDLILERSRNVGHGLGSGDLVEHHVAAGGPKGGELGARRSVAKRSIFP